MADVMIMMAHSFHSSVLCSFRCRFPNTQRSLEDGYGVKLTTCRVESLTTKLTPLIVRRSYNGEYGEKLKSALLRNYLLGNSLYLTVSFPLHEWFQ